MFLQSVIRTSVISKLLSDNKHLAKQGLNIIFDVIHSSIFETIHQQSNLQPVISLLQ